MSFSWERLVSLLEYNSETGDLIWIAKSNPKAHGDLAGSIDKRTEESRVA